jgi:hypothetical protein
VTEPTFQAWSDDPEAEVADVTTADEGRKLHRRLEHELRQHWHSMPDEAISAYERALNSLRLEFKAAGNENRRNVQRAGEAHERTEARPRSHATARAARGGGSRTRTRGYRGGGARGVAGRAFDDTGIPSAASDFRGLGLKAFGALVGLSVFMYVIDDRKAGPSAFSALIDGLGTALEVIVAPVDPLGGRAAAQQAKQWRASEDPKVAARQRAQAKRNATPAQRQLANTLIGLSRPVKPRPAGSSLVPGNVPTHRPIPRHGTPAGGPH